MIFIIMYIITKFLLNYHNCIYFVNLSLKKKKNVMSKIVFPINLVTIRYSFNMP